MKRSTRRTFEWIVCFGALSLPLIALLLGLGSGGTTIRAAVSSDTPPREAVVAMATASAASAAVAMVTAAATATATVAAAAPPASVSAPATASAVIPASSLETTSAAAPAHASATMPVVAHPSLSYRNSWVGNTWGYANERWVQIDVQALAVTPEGDVFTNAPWDEGGGEIGHYRDGQLVRYGGGSHGWGMLGGDAIAVNDNYVFAAQVVVSLGDEMAVQKHLPPKGVVWYGVSRRSRADIRKGVPFDGQADWPGSPVAFRTVTTGSDNDDYAIRGLAADATRLFVSNQRDNRIDIFDTHSMQPVGSFPVREPGRIALASDGSLWIMERSRTDGAARVVHHARNGSLLGTLALPVDTVPADVTLDARGRLLIADNGPRQQILIFTAAQRAPASAAKSASGAVKIGTSTHEDASMQLSATLGEAGGIYAGRAGAPGPLRFNGLTGVGVDRAGNVYVSMNGAGPRGFDGGPGNTDGALIESYTPDGKRRFSLQGLLFVDGAQFVDGQPPSVYSGTKRFALDLSRPVGEEWSYAGYTADRFRYPYDPYLNLKQGQRGTPLVRDVDGHRLLYTIDMNATYLRIYRFEADRETAIPSGLFANSHIDGAWPRNQPARGEWIWRDTAGNGRFAPADFNQSATQTDGPPVIGWWVDSKGDIWQAVAQQGIRRFPLQGFDHTGNPVYRYAALQTFAPPEQFNRIARVNYFPADDTMYLSGSTPQRPFLAFNWRGAGSMLARYDNWKSGKPVLRYTIDLPDQGPADPQSLSGFAVEGDYIFAVETRTGVVRVYDRDTGRDVGRLAPGPETGAASGLIDVTMPVTAHRLATGEYLVFVEEDWHGKAMMYRFTPPERAVKAASLQSK